MSMEQAIRRLWIIFAALSSLVAFGTIAFNLAEGLNLFDSLYLTVTIISTVGFGDIVPETALGRMIYMVLVLVGIGIFGYAVSSIASIMAERSIFKLARGFFFLGGEGKLKNHIIVIGWNEISKSVCSELKANGYDVVVVVEEDENAREASKAGYNALVGSPLEESTYKHVRIDSASAVVLTGGDSSKNLMTILRIRDVSRTVRIIVVCDNDLMKSLFYRAGADQVINLAKVSGRILASFVFEPLVAEIIEDLSEAETGLDAEQIIYQGSRELTIKELKDLGFEGVVFAIVRGSKRHYYPSEDFMIKPGDVMIIMGLREHLDRDAEILRRI
ncbi:MAG: potassium channel protein [Thaumarchaeota archaeon]|nr:potassium channel protein [Nitrososphaerota archaeon]